MLFFRIFFKRPGQRRSVLAELLPLTNGNTMEAIMTNTKSKPATPEEIWSILREVSQGQKETDRQMKENDHILHQRMKETDRQMQETDHRLKKLDILFNGQWGKLVEALVRGDLIRVLNEWGIEVEGIAKEHCRIFEGKEYEFDIIAVNGDTVIVVEVKTTLSAKDVDCFIDKIKIFKQAFKEYRDKKVCGAVAYIKANEGSRERSENKGLYVIQAVGGHARIINEAGFCPKVF